MAIAGLESTLNKPITNLASRVHFFLTSTQLTRNIQHTMDFNVNQLVRSAVILVIGAPISLAATLNAMPEKVTETEADKLKAELTFPCLRYALTKADSKGERAAKDTVDEIFGDGGDYREVCKWVLG